MKYYVIHWDVTLEWYRLSQVDMILGIDYLTVPGIHTITKDKTLAVAAINELNNRLVCKRVHRKDLSPRFVYGLNTRLQSLKLFNRKEVTKP